jgi:hypothetical protein
MDTQQMERKIKRDSLIVIPTFIFICLWLFALINTNVDLAPGADYGTSMAVNLLIPLLLISAAQIAYAVVLIVDCVRLQGKSRGEKAVICVGVWFAVNWLFIAVYIYRLVRFIIWKKKTTCEV